MLILKLIARERRMTQEIYFHPMPNGPVTQTKIQNVLIIIKLKWSFFFFFFFFTKNMNNHLILYLMVYFHCCVIRF